MEEDGGGQGSHLSRYLSPQLVIVALITVGVLAFAAGNLTALGLRDDLSEVTEQRDDESKRAASLAKQLKAQDREIQALESRVAKVKRSAPASPKVGKAVEGLIEIGEAHSVGTMEITPTAFSELSSTGETTTFQTTISVKNNGSEGISPFCGEEGSLVDSTGRTFDANSELDFDSSNCGDDIQPGLTQSDYRLTFTLPSDAKPIILKLWGDFEYEGTPQLWNVKGL